MLLQPDLERNLVVKFLLQALQLWAFCEAILEHGNGNSYGEGIDHDKIQEKLHIFPYWRITQFFCIFCIKDAGMDWILHLDTDELIHPAGAREYSLRQLLLDVPKNVDTVVFPNYVSSFLYARPIPEH